MADLLDNETTDHEDDVDDNGGGSFGQPGDIFGNPVPSSENPQVTRAQEQAPENLPNQTPPQSRRDLAFFQDAYGNLTCAWVIDGNISEQPRVPTDDERKLAPQAQWRQVPRAQPAPQAQPLQQPSPLYSQGQNPLMRGQPVAMGIAALGQAGPVQQAPVVAAVPPTSMFATILKVAIVGAAGYGVYCAYQQYSQEGKKTEDDATADEMAEADDVEAVTEV